MIYFVPLLSLFLRNAMLGGSVFSLLTPAYVLYISWTRSRYFQLRIYFFIFTNFKYSFTYYYSFFLSHSATLSHSVLQITAQRIDIVKITVASASPLIFSINRCHYRVCHQIVIFIVIMVTVTTTTTVTK